MKRRRRKGLGGWRKLSSGRWQFRIRGYRPDGQPFALSQVCETNQKEQVQAKLRTIAEDYRAGLIVPSQQVTLAKWQQKCKRQGFMWSPQDSSKWKLLRPLWQVKLDGLDQSVIATWVNRTLYRGQGKTPKGKASPGYTRHAFALLRRLIKEAIVHNVIQKTPWGPDTPSCIPRYSRAHKKRTSISSDDIEAILMAAKKRNESLYIRILLSATTAARPVELCKALRKWMVPIEQITNAPSIQGAGVLSLPAVKGGVAHDVPIPPNVYKIYTQWWDRLPKEAKETGLLLPIRGKDGKHKALTTWVSKESWRAICQSAGVDGVVLYQLRHSRLEYLANTMGPRIAQAIAGHTSVITTERYAGKARGIVQPAFMTSWGINDNAKEVQEK